MIEAQQTWTEIEAQITAARRFYNAAVNQLNNAIQIFPGSILAGIAGVTAMPFFEAPADGSRRADRGRHPRPQAMTADSAIDLAALERRRRLVAPRRRYRAARRDRRVSARHGGSAAPMTATRSAAPFLFAAIAGVIACPWIVRAWQSFMRRRMIAAVVAGRTDIRHIDGERQRPAARTGAVVRRRSASAAFRDSGLVEPFESAGVHHILTGDAQGVPFAIAEIALLDAKGYRMFGGVLGELPARAPASRPDDRRPRPRPARQFSRARRQRDRSGCRSRIPSFEGVFEVYGTDQVGGRVVLTTTMLERLKALDELAHARGFACAFLDDHLLVAFRGMSWRCPSWRILKPVDAWLQGYVARLAGWSICRWRSSTR